MKQYQIDQSEANKSAFEESKKEVYPATFRDGAMFGSNHTMEVLSPVLEAAQDAISQVSWKHANEIMPLPGLAVLAFAPNDKGKGFRVRACWIPKFFMPDDGDTFSGDADYDEEKDEYFWPEGWYEWNEEDEAHWFISKPITHWMNLPPYPDNSPLESALQQIQRLEKP